MSKKYLVWKNPNCNGQNIEWVEMTGNQFYVLIKKAENKNRRFVRLINDVSFDDDVIFIEATEVQYKAWRKEKNAQYRLFRFNRLYETVSMDYPLGNNCHHELHEIIADESVDVEKEVISTLIKKHLVEALDFLQPQQKAIIKQFYFDMMTNQELAQLYGVSYAAVSQKIDRALKQLKKFL